MKKKVGIVSCYFQANYGSQLQALATQMALDKLGYDNETINVSGFNHEIRKAKIKYFAKASLTSDILLSKIGMAKNVFYKKFLKNAYTRQAALRTKRFHAFSQSHFRLSQPFSTREEAGHYYTDIVVGSDQLWLPANIAADYYTLNWVPNHVNTVAYATSFGQSALPSNISRKATTFLNRIRHLSIREESGQHLIQNLVGRQVPVVCDPTLLFIGEDWLQIQHGKPLIGGKYILCYFLGNNPPHREFAKRLREKTGYKIVALPHLDEFVKSDEHYADIMAYDVDPADFLNLIRNAAYVCTDSFHCSVFSILYKKIFFTFRRYTHKTKSSTNSRIDTLFKLSGVDGRIMEGNEDICDVLQIPIDYTMVHSRLNKLRKMSYEYLSVAIEDSRSTDL